MQCLDCGSENELQEASCIGCGASLHPARARLYLDRADQEISQGEYDAAALNIAQADQEILASGKEQGERYALNAYAFFLQAQMLYQKGKVEQARDDALLAEQAMALTPGDSHLLVRIYRLLGNTYYYEGKMSEATFYFRRMAEISDEIGNYENALIAAVNLGNISILSSDIAHTVEHYNHALGMAYKDGKPSSFARVYRVLAWLHASYGPFPLGIEYADKAMALRDQIANLDTRSLVVNEAAGVYLKGGMFERAEPYLHEVYGIAQQTGSKLIEERLMPYLVMLLRQQNDNASWFANAVRLFNDADSSAVFKSDLALQIALYYIEQQDWTRVGRHLQRLTDHAHDSPLTEGVAAFYHALGALHGALGEWDEAATAFKDALGQQAPAFDQAQIWKDYAAMLLRKAEVEPDARARAEGNAALEQAALLFREIQLDYELELIAAMRAMIAD